MQGVLEKMISELNTPVEYALSLGDTSLALNPLLGQPITLRFSGDIFCTACGRKTKKSFNQGYCFPCSQSLAQCDICIVRPERCHYHQGTCREPEWGLSYCMQPHYVYLANSSGIKVGITRESQIPTRWIDQGARQAIPIFKVKSRHLAGLLEVILGQHVSDKTNWRKMLRGDAEEVDLIESKASILSQCEKEIEQLTQQYEPEQINPLQQESSVSISYPVLEYPQKITSLNFDKTPDIKGTLRGIKGQYLILDSGVINIRKFTGYNVAIS